MTTTAIKNKTVSNTAMFVCTILDLIEPNDLDMRKVYNMGPRIDKFLYDMDRQIKKASADEFYQLDISSEDLQSIALAAEKHVNKLRQKCTYRSMHKTLSSFADEHAVEASKVNAWMGDIKLLFYVCGLLHRLQCVCSYQAIMLHLSESEKEHYKIENVMARALRDAIKKGPDVW